MQIGSLSVIHSPSAWPSGSPMLSLHFRHFWGVVQSASESSLCLPSWGGFEGNSGIPVIQLRIAQLCFVGYAETLYFSDKNAPGC